MTLFSAGDASPIERLPLDACDCHMHLFDTSREPVEGAALTPPTATFEDYQGLQQRLGSSRNVFVQPSTYGTDNSLMIDALKKKRSQARGVAVVNETVTDEELDALDNAGVVGVRFNQVQKGATTFSMLGTLVPRLRQRAWHIQFHLTPEQLIAEGDALADLQLPVVLDHFARIFRSPAIADPAITTLWRLLRSEHVWLKLSAPYLASRTGAPNFADLAKTSRALVQEFPQRLVWGTDWPHATETEAPDDALLLNWFNEVVPDADTRQRILVDNPAALYRF